MKVRRKAAGKRRTTTGKFIIRGILLLLFFLVLHVSLLTGIAVAMPMEELLKQYLKDNYPWPDVEITGLVVVGEPGDRNPSKILVERGLPNRTVFAVEYGNGKRISATAMVKAFDWVVMTRRAYRKGYLLQKEDVYRTLMDITRIPKDAVSDTDQVIGSALTRSVIANMPVVGGMTGGAQQVKRGQRVTIIAESGSISMVAKGELKENASVGDEVRVLNVDSKKIVGGRLITADTVRVEF
ncbi:MAG: flagellar basal body P-ring formation protein FlgA [Nitrospirales bacterium]|nr:flagellar basal body P-ring formation protein FlgA [Nitrospirales bacterium]